jgi:hypothetical protein
MTKKSRVLFCLTPMFVACLSVLLCPRGRAQWTPAGECPGGVVSALLVDGDTLYAGLGYPDGGLHRSTDAGVTWHPRGLPGIPVTSLARCGQYLLAGTWYSGIFRSYDGGATWQNPMNYEIAYSFAVADSNVYAGTNGRGIITSTNRGGTWTVSGPLDNWIDYGVTVADPYVFAITSSNLRPLVRSPRSAPTASVFLPTPGEPGQIVWIASLKSKVLLSTTVGLFVSSDYGLSWVRGDSGLPEGRVATEFCTMGDSMMALVGAELYSSTDIGISWHLHSSAPQNVDLTAFVANDRLFAVGTSGAGVYVSSDQGKTWNEPGIGLRGKATSLLSRGGELFMGSEVGGVYRSTDNGQHWIPSRTGMGNAGNCVLTGNVSTIFAAGSRPSKDFFRYNTPDDDGQPDGPLFRSTNEGRTWMRMDTSNGLVYDEGWRIQAEGSWVWASVGSGGEMSCIVESFVSYDKGDSWVHVDSLRTFVAFDTTRSLLFAGAGRNGWYGGRQPFPSEWSKSFGVHMSPDGGKSWSRTGYPSISVGMLAAHRDFVAAGGSRYDSLARKWRPEFHLSADLGKSWRGINAGILGEGESLLWIDNELVAGTTAGVFHLRPGDTVWAPYNEGLAGSQTGSLTVHGPFLFLIQSSDVAASGFVSPGTVWRRPIVELVTGITPSVTPVPEGFTLGQNYPNPFNPSTTIRYGLPVRSQVTLAVFNTLGQEVARLVQGEQEAGYHEVKFDGSKLASGVYFYQLQAGDFVQSKKLMVLK